MAVTANVSRKSGRVAAKEASKPRESKQPKLKKTMSVDAKSEKKKKQPAASGSQRSHPPYFQMAVEAIATLRERTGSSRRAIAKYIEAHYKSDLPSNFKKLLTNQLRILSQKGKLVQVKRSFKLTEELKKSSQVKAIKAATKPPAASSGASSGKPVAAKKPKPAEPAQAKKQTVSAKSPKPKAAEKPKAKAAVKPKAKAVSEKKSPPPPAPAPAPAPPVSTPKVQKIASVVSVKKEKPSSSKAAKLKPVKTSTPAKSTPAPRKSPRGAPPAAASKKPITSPPPKKKKKTARN